MSVENDRTEIMVIKCCTAKYHKDRVILETIEEVLKAAGMEYSYIEQLQRYKKNETKVGIDKI